MWAMMEKLRMRETGTSVIELSGDKKIGNTEWIALNVF
jgi:hypothetical protein